MSRLKRPRPAIRLEEAGLLQLNEYVHAVSFSPDGMRLAACTAAGEVAIWNLDSESNEGEGEARSNGDGAPALALAWEPTGGRLASGGQDGRVRLWETTSGKEQVSILLDPKRGWVEHLAWDSVTGRLAASVGKKLFIWEGPENGALSTPMEVPEHKNSISGLQWMLKGEGLISAGYGGAWLWRIGKADAVRTFPYEGALLSVSLSPNGTYLASGNLDGSVHLWQTDTKDHWHMPGYPMKVHAVEFDHNGAFLYTVSGAAVVVWDMKRFEGSSGKLLDGHQGWIRQVACHPGVPIAATADEAGVLFLWEPKRSKPIASTEITSVDGFSCIAWSPDGDRLAVGSGNGAVLLLEPVGLS